MTQKFDFICEKLIKELFTTKNRRQLEYFELLESLILKWVLQEN